MRYLSEIFQYCRFEVRQVNILKYLRIQERVQTQGKHERADAGRMRVWHARTRVSGAHTGAARMLERVQRACGSGAHAGAASMRNSDL
eukprot:4848056-Pleurochrysis_carterae.AAC.2